MEKNEKQTSGQGRQEEDKATGSEMRTKLLEKRKRNIKQRITKIGPERSGDNETDEGK